MNQLFKHIEFLLLRHDCVIVPGLGAFIASLSPAKIDMEKGLIVPPSRTLMFNQAVTLDDGLLANSYARKYNLSFEGARMVILREVNAVISKIQKEGAADCGNIGRLIKGEEGNLVFTRFASISAFNAGLGYTTVEFDLKADAPSQIPAADIPEPAVLNDSDSTEQGFYHFKISKTFTRMAAAFLVVAAVAITVLLNPIPRDERVQKASVVPVEALMPSPTKTAATPQDSAGISESQIDTPVKPEPMHYLIVATFSSPREAEYYASNYSTDEYKLTPVPSKKMCRVAIAASDNREELRKQLNTKAISSRFPNAWIWSRP